MISLWLVTGFLGAGKTSFLSNLAVQRAEETLVFLINEFASRDVDGARLSLAIRSDSPPAANSHTVETIPGGSIFCACLVSEFIARLRRVARQEPKPGAVIIEASGTANPLVIEKLLSDAKLSREYALDLVVAVVDPGSFGKLVSTLPNIADQVKAADLVVINKVDLHGPEVLSQTEGLVRRLNPTARILRASFGNLAAPAEWGGPCSRGLAGQLAPCKDPHYLSQTLFPATPFPLEVLRAGLDKYGHAIFRLKGHVQTQDGWMYIDYSGSGLSVTVVPTFTGPAMLAAVIRPTADEPVLSFLGNMGTRSS
jgi:G3E family GTPase